MGILFGCGGQAPAWRLVAVGPRHNYPSPHIFSTRAEAEAARDEARRRNPLWGWTIEAVMPEVLFD
jgi:hypothetical protein